MDDRTLFRYHPDYAADAKVTPALDWSAWPGPQGGLLGAVEMCNNNGTCRKFDAGVMCPSFRATRDEQHLTRGRAIRWPGAHRPARPGCAGLRRGACRAEALRLLQGLPAGMPDRRRHGEDEDRGHGGPRPAHGVSAKDRLIATMPRWAPFASLVPFLANARDSIPGPRRPVGTPARLRRRPDPAALPPRRLPRCRIAGAGRAGGRGHPLPRRLQPLLRAGEPARRRPRAGRRRLPRRRRPAGRGSRPLDEGRTLLAAGLVEEARAEARRTLAALSAFASPVIGIEPSSLLTLRDEFPSLLPGEAASALAGRALLLSEFLVREKPRLALKPIAAAPRISTAIATRRASAPSPPRSPC